MKKFLTASLMALVVLALPAYAQAYPSMVGSSHLRPGCNELFTVPGTERVARHIYAGTRHVPMARLRTLGYRERCQRNPMAQGFVRSFDRTLDALHKQRILAALAPPPAPVAAAPSASGGWSGPWACIAKFESGGNPAENTGNGFYGGLQFTKSTWQSYGGVGNPADASITEQETIAEHVLNGWNGQPPQGWGAWPNTSRMCGYR